MKKIIFLTFLLAGCTYQQTISSYNKIDSSDKTVAIRTSYTNDINQEFKQILAEAGFKIYNKNSSGYTTHYDLFDDVQKDENVRCGILEDGYTYDIKLIDSRKKEEVFQMNGQGCHDNIIKDFTSLINNRYDEKEDKKDTPDADVMKAPTLKSDGRTWWSN